MRAIGWTLIAAAALAAAVLVGLGQTVAEAPAGLRGATEIQIRIAQIMLTIAGAGALVAGAVVLTGAEVRDAVQAARGSAAPPPPPASPDRRFPEVNLAALDALNTRRL